MTNTATEIIRSRIAALKPHMEIYPDLYKVFEKCFLNTLETTVQPGDGDTFVITGDIPAMWLRDSTAQVLHYLRFADDENVATLIEGLIARQAKNVLLDPYANAYNREPNDFKPYDDTPRASDWVWERKYEIDSLCHAVLLAWRFYEKTGRTGFMTEMFAESLRTIVDVFRTEQNHDESTYRFQRTNCPPCDTLVNDGKGAPVKVTGMTWSGFRPSDDACMYGYLVPANLFAAQELGHVAKFAEIMGDEELKAEAEEVKAGIEKGIEEYAKVQHPEFGEIYAFETDGYGNYNLMDDANVPSLLALPYLGICEKDDALYLRTRQFVLSKENPYYYEGACAKGVGSPHTPKGYVWPIGLCVQGMTSTSTDEIAQIVDTLMHTHAGCECMHESFDPDAPEHFTREWFAWANSMFGELMYRTYESGKLAEVLNKALTVSAANSCRA